MFHWDLSEFSQKGRRDYQNLSLRKKVMFKRNLRFQQAMDRVTAIR